MDVKRIKVTTDIMALVTLLLSLIFQNKNICIALLIAFVVAAFVLYRRAVLMLTELKSGRTKNAFIKSIMIAMICIVVGIVAFGLLVKKGKLVMTNIGSQILVTCIIAVIIFAFGMAAQRLPFNQGMGLRVPWTVNDEPTWNVAHNIWGNVSLPMGVMCFAGLGSFGRVELWLLCILFAWLVLPLSVSHNYLIRKWRGKI